MQEDQDVAAEGTVERRAALRRGAAVLAGVAGLGVAAAATAPGAAAAPGDNLVLGQANDAGEATTSVTSASNTTATLVVANTGDGAPLNVALQPQQLPSADSVAGDIASFELAPGFGFPAYTHAAATADTDPVNALIYTTGFAAAPIAVTPQRALDTRNPGGRSRIFPLSNLDAQGRLIGGRTVTLNLSEFALSEGGVFANVTVTAPTGNGFITLFPSGTRPPTSNLNYVTNQTASNFSFTATELDPDAATLTIQIFATTTTHVIIDVTGFAVADPFGVNPAITGGTPAARAAAAKRVAPAKRPAWYPKDR